MNSKPYCLVSATIFLLVALAHLSRLFAGWEIVLAGWVAPHWVSIPGLVLPALLAAWGFASALRRRGPG